MPAVRLPVVAKNVASRRRESAVPGLVRSLSWLGEATVNVHGRRQWPKLLPSPIPGYIRTFQILRKATNSAECCLFRRVFVISAVCSFLAERFKYPATSFRPDFWEGPGREYDFPAGVWRKGVWRLVQKRLSPEAGGGEAAWCDGSRRAGELTPGSTRVKKPKSWRSACAL